MKSSNSFDAAGALRFLCFVLATAGCVTVAMEGTLFEELVCTTTWLVCTLCWILGKQLTEADNYPAVSWHIGEDGE